MDQLISTMRIKIRNTKTGEITDFYKETVTAIPEHMIFHANEKINIPGTYTDTTCADCNMFIAVLRSDYKDGANFCRNCVAERLGAIRA